VGYDVSGKRRRRYVYGATKGEVLEKLTRLQHQALTGTLGDPQRLTVAEFVRRWLEDAARPGVRDSTYRLYDGLLRLHVLPKIGGVVLSRLTPAHVQGVLSSMEQAGKSARLRQMVFAVLHAAFGQAVKWGMVLRNVLDAVARPRAPRPTMQVLTPDQVAILLAAAKGDRLEALYVLAISTGLRQGELLGLQWEDTDLDRGAVQVRHQLAENNGHPVLVEPKTASARRRVDLPAVAVLALLDHRARMQAEGRSVGEGFVFTDTAGGPIRKSNLIRRSFEPLLRRAGLPRIRFHDLRHTSATLLLAEGVHPKIVQERLGHSRINLTLDVYSHLLPSMGKEAAARLDALFDSMRV
jgi:integrase